MTPNQLPPPDQTPQHIAGVDHAHELLRRMGYQHDGDWLIHVNRRGAEAIHVSTISTIVNAAHIALAALAQQAQEPVGDRYFTHSTDWSFEEYATREEAIKSANAQIEQYREDAIQGAEWPGEVDSVCWGVILGRAKEIDTSIEDHESVDYQLCDTTPQPQPAQPVPEKCLTCNGHALIGGHLPDGSSHGEPCHECNAPPVPAPVDEREAFEAWYSDHATKHNAHGLTFTVEGIAELREADHYGEHRTYLNNLWEGWQSRAAPQSPAPQTKGGEA